MSYLTEICIKHKKNESKYFPGSQKRSFFMMPNFFQSRVKIVNTINFLHKLVQNVAKTFKKTAC
jgi:hypothetical protein